MRYEDASGTFSAVTGNPDARDDVDALPAGSHGPATGNTITGAGTISGVAGADLVPDGAGKIVALEGAGGSDTSDGGSLHVGGRFGDLTMDTHGNYKYAPNVETPNGARDVFRYTLADNAGARDAATLTIEIGREPQKIDANAQQIIPGPDGVVTLPPGVELSDVHVVGRNLVIDMPDGSQMIIVDGAVFVPQLVLNGVEVPATNLAALLVDSEPQPAAGIPQSSGGNFDVPVPPLDPGIPLGDLIPPTELGYTPPEFHDVGQFIDQEPEITIQPDGQPASIAALDSVNEAGLPARNEGEPAGSGEIADSNGSNNSDPSEATTGVILVDSPDDPSVIRINGEVVTGAIGQVISGDFGTLTITSFSEGQIGYSYLLTDNNLLGNTSHDDFSVSVTDNDGDVATATLRIDIIDDVPTARNDTDASANGVATGNVITDAAPGDAGDSDTNAADTVGADNASLTSVTGFGGSADSTFSGGLLNVNGQFGTLAIDAAGNYTYTVNPNAGGGGVDVFTYTLNDGDGDTSTATLTITNPDLFPHTDPNPLVRTDDDAVPLANGNPGGVDDDVDAENLTGTLSGSGGDGALTFDLLTTGAPAGFTYVDGAGGSVLVQQVQGGSPVTVLTITIVPTTGAYTVTQNAPIDHPAGSDENNVSFNIAYSVTDVDGDAAPGSLTINVDDDTPTIGREDISAPTLTVDETDLTINATGNFSTLFDVSYGADGPGTTSYAVSVVNGTDSGLVDVATGQSIFLFNNAGVVEGHVGNSIGGAVAFTLSVDGSGVVTLDQVRALDHPDATNPDDTVSPNADSIQLTVSAVDGDGDPVSQTINIGDNLDFDDDGPSLSNLQAGPGVTLDETTAVTPAGFPISASSSGPVITGTTAYGADGAGTTAYGLTVVGGGATALKTAIGDFAITLVQSDAQTITGQYNDGGLHTAFTVHINADGTITVTENVPLEHNVDGSTPAAYNDALDLSGLINATITVTDRDGDTATGSVGIGNLITFLDDGPSVDVTAGSDANVLLQTQDADTIGAASDTAASSANFSGAFGLSFAGGADGAAGTPVIDTYTLNVSSSGVDSGLNQSGANIYLYVIGGKVVGSTSATIGAVSVGNTVFDVAVSGTGVVTLTQYSQIDHPLADDPTASGTPFADQLISMADNLVTLTGSSTVTDNDGDTATDSATINIGANLQFADDGPDISASLAQGAQLRIDETDGVGVGAEVDPIGGDLGTVTVSAASLFSVANLHVSADSPTTLSYGFTLASQGVASGLLLSTTNAPIFLYNVGGVVYGSTSVTVGGVNVGNTVFTATIDAGTGAVTLTQFYAVEHTDTTSFNELSSAIAAGALNVTITATDSDGDTDSASVDLGSVTRFLDDGPTIDVTTNADAGILLQTQDADTIGAATDTNSSAVNFGGAFNLTSNGGSDGAANTPTLSYSLGVSAPGVDSGLDQSGANIYLYVIGGKVVGSTSVTVGGVNAGNTVFDVGVSGTGVVTLTQYSQIDHPLEAGLNNAPFADQIISMTDSLVTLTASSSITDNDGDTAVDSATINIGNNLQFADHGPIATNDTDTIVGGNGPATGNVITGVDIVGGDANVTDGNVDTIGADIPGTITRIQSVNVPANIDTSYDGSGNLVVVGQYGTLTINADGSYSYLRTTGAGGVSDTFTYTLTDRDGDTATATLTIGINDNFPNLPDPALVRLDDDVIPGANGNLDGPGDDNPDAVPGNVVSGTLVGSGGDGALTYNFTGINTLPAGFSVGAGSDADTLLINQGATLVMTIQLNQATGAFTVTQNAPMLHPADTGGPEDNIENNLPFSIGVEVQDADGDVEPATITINVDDDTPTIDVTKAADAGVVLQTQDADTIGAATDTNVTTANFGGVFGLTQSVGADGGAAATLSYTLGVSAPGADSGLDQGGASIFLYTIGGKVVGSTSATLGGVSVANTVFDVGVSGTGVVTLTQYSQIDHPIGSDPTPTGTPYADHIIGMVDSLVTLTASSSLTDNDGDTVTDSETVNIGANLTIADHGPTAAVVTTGQTVSLDESAGNQADSNDVTGPLTVFDGVANKGDDLDVAGTGPIQFATNATALVVATGSAYGADGAGTTVFGLSVAPGGVDSGLDTTAGTNIYLFKEGDLVVGRVGATAGVAATGPAAFALSIDPSTGAVSMVEYLSILHPNPANPDESVSITNGAVQATVTVTDGDGDTATNSVNIGSQIQFQDDGPTLGTVQSQQTDNLPADNNGPGLGDATGTLHFAPGADGPGTTMTITADATGITSGGHNLLTVQAGNVLTAYQDTNNDGIHQVGETTQVFTITVNPTAGTSGQYVFDLITPLDPTVTEVAIGGSASFGAGPTAGQILETALGTDISVVSGYHNTASFNFANWFGGTDLTPAMLTTAGVNGSTSGWGIDDNNFNNPDELFVFDFGSGALADPDGAGGYVPPATTLPDITFVKFDFIHYSSGAGDAGDDIAYVVNYSDGTFDSGWIPAVNIDGATWQFNADAGKFIADVQFFSGREPSGAVQDLPAGKVDLVSVGTTSTTIDETISASVQLTDGDGDTTTVGNFTIHIGTGLNPFAPAAAAPLNTKTSSTVQAPLTNSVLVGAIAAAGLESSTAAAAHDSVSSGHQAAMADTSVADSAGSLHGPADHNLAAARAALSVETREAGDAQPQSGSSAHHGQEAASNSLTAGDSHQSQTAAPLLEGTEASAQSAPAQSSFTSGGVGMPSAEMLAAANANDNALEGHAKSSAAVQHVLFDALAGGGHGPNIDAVIDAVANQAHGGGQAAIDALASHGPAAVSGWDMTTIGGFTGVHAAFTMEHMALHIDAAPPAA